jgi:hypothetical protein
MNKKPILSIQFVIETSFEDKCNLINRVCKQENIYD